jgi:hypothetical protein
VHFVRNLTENLSLEFPDLWKLGQTYFKGDLVVDADAGKSAVFKEMVLGSIRYFCNLIRAAVIPQTFDKKGEDVVEYGKFLKNIYNISCRFLHLNDFFQFKFYLF